ncbi:hypothetical protein GW17_00038598, partial [Ensete ventricosum]
NKVTIASTAAITSKVYDDDEPLLLVSKPNQRGSVWFNPIPKASKEDKQEEAYDNNEETKDMSKAGGILVIMMPQATLLSKERRHRSYVVALKVRVPPIGSFAPLCIAIDLVSVLDVRQGMTREKLWMLKCTMQLVVSSLGLGTSSPLWPSQPSQVLRGSSLYDRC